MRMNRRGWMQLSILVVVSLAAFGFLGFGYVKLPSLLFGAGEYTVKVELPAAAGLYPRGNVTYRGTEVGQVEAVNLTDSGVEAVLKLRSDVKIPSDLQAEVHSQTAIGEQYVALLPRSDTAPPLRDGSVIPLADTKIPPDINALLDATNRGLDAIPRDDLRTAVDESYLAFGGLGPDISRLVKGSTALAIDAKANLNELTNVIDNVAPVLDTQTDTSDSIQSWAAHLSTISQQLRENDPAVTNILREGGSAADQVRQLFDRLKPTLPIVLTNLVSLGDIAVTYRDNLEQILVLLPKGTEAMQAIGLANRKSKQPYEGAFLSFNLNLNLPPTCSTGFLPIQQQRVPSFEDYPDRPAGDVYCRVPQDSPFNVRGARNIPCETRPGKRAPTVKLCESEENYVPLNDGFNWKGDPNATLSGQSIPQMPPGTPPERGGDAPPPPPAAPPIAIAEYDPATGNYVGPDGQVYNQSNLNHDRVEEKTWQSMLVPPPGN
jgi:phospholipid/cholesterol/gamma-HCH transport system substrate-binding protein